MKAYESNYGTLFHADNLAILKAMPDNSIEALVTDPPYGISFMGKKWDYDVPAVDFWKEVYRVMKPGAHGLVACGTRTQHRMAVNLEDAGFEIRDLVMWVYGSGFPKSLNIGKVVDQLRGDEREPLMTIYKTPSPNGYKYDKDIKSGGPLNGKVDVTKGTSEWEGWGTALKPSLEIFTLIRKPISEKNIAENVLKWGTGGINIDGCRVGYEERTQFSGKGTNGSVYNGFPQYNAHWQTVSGRFPANFIHDGSEEVTALFPENKSVASKRGADRNGSVYGKYNLCDTVRGHNDEGSAARFFYCAKASPSERNEGLEELEAKNIQHDFGSAGFATTRVDRKFPMVQNFHPTVKPIALLEYLCKLITPPGGTVLDPFAGSGTTGIAALNTGFRYILIEREEEYIPIITGRLRHWEKKKAHEPGDLFEEAI